MRTKLDAVLIVEDDYSIARDLADAFKACGVRAVMPASDIDTADEISTRHGLDLALLDIKLGDEVVFPLANKLMGQGVPILFATGCPRHSIPERFDAVPVIEKPFDARLLASSLMDGSTQNNAAVHNSMLAQFPEAFLAEIRPHLSRRSLRRGERLAPTSSHLWFPESALVALELDPADGCAAGLIGRDGALGVAGNDRFIGVTHVPGTAIRIDKPVFQHSADGNKDVRAILCTYLQGLHLQTAQILRTASVRNVPQRVAHWLLLCSERIGQKVPITQDTISIALSVRRAGVTEAINLLVAAGLIATGRGQITILDRGSLEHFSKSRIASEQNQLLDH